MTDNSSTTQTADTRPELARWSGLLRSDDWWAIWIGLGLVVVAYLLFAGGSTIKWIAVAPAK